MMLFGGVGPRSNKRLLLSRQPSTSRATLAVTTLAAQQNRGDVGWRLILGLLPVDSVIRLGEHHGSAPKGVHRL